MQMSDERQIAAPPETVWTALFDPEVLRACVPGCQELSGSAADGYEAVVVQKVGPVKATFKGVVTMKDVVEGESCTLSGEGKGGAAGFAKGDAHVRLSPGENGGTLLSYEVDAKVGGKLAQLGSRIVDGFARRMAGEFFTRFQAEIEGPPATEQSDPENPSLAENDAEQAPPKKKGWVRRVLG
ncbi:CoxG family protein [Roseinatronobacter sp.]|uniref:CoxG family protein n=1 Tax=Roseinatronobacter sp. TaxID=1945755 RepID=UPI0025EADAF9|nr:carbon monoxide dehydrogenase subunit G [Rhodobaca sp.]